MIDPVSERLALAGRGGYISPSGLASFREKYRNPDMLPVYADFSENPVTKTVVKAIRDLALCPALVSGSEDSYPVQHGITVGLGLAAQLLEDPSVVFPEMFRGSPAQADAMPSYSTTVDDLIDRLPDEEAN